jgi:hypothetical protein
MNQNPNIVEYIFFGGQSGMLGPEYNTNLDANYTGNIANVNNWSDVFNGNQLLNATGTIRNPMTTHSWDIHFMKDLQAQLNQTLYELKIAISGSGVNQTNMQWYTGGYAISDLETMWESIKRYYSTQNKACVVKYMFWDQGEAEAAGGYTANQYRDLMILLFENVKRIFNNPNLKFFARRLSLNQTFYSETQLNIIRSGQQQFANLYPGKVFIVNSDNCTFWDTIHMNEAGLLQFRTNLLTVFNANILNP